MAPVIRPAVSADALAVVGLRELMFASMGLDVGDHWQDAATAWFAAAVADEDAHILVADLDGQIVAAGLAQIVRTPPSPGSAGTGVYIGNMATLPAARGLGLATRILDGLLAWAVERGADRAELHATEAGRPIYEGVGFEETSCPSMRLSLRP